MPEPTTYARKQPLNSLSTKIIFLVFISTFLTALVVSWISVQSTHTFLRAKMDQSFPVILATTAERLRALLAHGSSQMESIATHAALVEHCIPEGTDGCRAHLREALDGADVFQALRLRDATGEEVLVVGVLPDGPADGPLPVASAALIGRPGEFQGSLQGFLNRALFARVLQNDGLSEDGELFVIDREGRFLLGPRSSLGTHAEPGALPASSAPEVYEYRNHSDRHVVGALLPMTDLGWRLVLEESFEMAFAPVFAVVTRVFVIDLSIILLFSFVAYQITSTIVRPIEALSEGARSISRGELDVRIPDPQTRDEVGLLTRTFNDMTHKLRAHQIEIDLAKKRLVRDKEELERANEVLEQLSITDGLTKLHNHRFFQDHLTREINRVSRTKTPLSMLMIDIDDFKQLNDRLGHAAGDALLVQIAQIMADHIRDSDLLARYGGEEFVVVASGTGLEGATLLAEKLRTSVAEASFVLDDLQRTQVTVSVGVAEYEGDRKTFFKRADRALYRAKAEGKNCVVCADPEID